MQKNLNKQERQRVSTHFVQEGQQHPLLLICSVIFTLRAGKLESIKAEAEDVFNLVAWILDSLFSWPMVEIQCQQEIDDLWNEQTQSLRNWPDSTVSDRYIIVDMVFRIVRKLLCHHWDPYYSERLYSMFCTTIERESANGNKEEQQRIQKRLSDYSENLDEWINNEYNGHLSEEIEVVIKGQIAEVKPLKRRSGRKPKDLNIIVESFNYLSQLDDRVPRLQAFFQSLKAKFIAIGSNQQDFIDTFIGVNNAKKIVWIQEINKLKYLILHIEKYIACPKGFTKWQIVCAHFQIRQRQKEMVDNKTDDSYVIEDLQPKQFTKGGKIPQEDKDLDRIIRILDPKTNYTDALQDYLDAQLEHDTIKDTEDALANGLNTDIRI